MSDLDGLQLNIRGVRNTLDARNTRNPVADQMSLSSSESFLEVGSGPVLSRALLNWVHDVKNPITTFWPKNAMSNDLIVEFLNLEGNSESSLSRLWFLNVIMDITPVYSEEGILSY